MFLAMFSTEIMRALTQEFWANILFHLHFVGTTKNLNVNRVLSDYYLTL